MTESAAWRLDGQVSLVIGAAGGIGAAVCRELAALGSMLVAVDVDPAVHAVAAELGERRVRTVLGDAGDRHVLTEAIDAAGRFDADLGVLVHAAMLDRRAPVDRITDDAWHAVTQGTLAGPWRAAQEFAHALDGAPGSCVFVSSVHAYRAYPDCAPYAAAKAGLNALVRALAVELGPNGLRANAVVPGFVRVPRNRAKHEDPEWRRRLAQRYPLRRLAEPDEVARAAAFLALGAASFVTGACLPVDGGLLARSAE